MPGFAAVHLGRERWSGRAALPRHRHDLAYAALVLAGGYEECGSRGRFRVGPGDVLLHGPFEGHLDRFSARGADLLNVRLTASDLPPIRLGRIDDPDRIARQRTPSAAAAELVAQLRALPQAPADWPDLLALDLIAHPTLRLDDWARRHGVAAATVSRGFRRIFGVAPATFRFEARAHRAFEGVLAATRPLAEIAAAAGFADQAHMTRAVRALTGEPPGRWRRSNRFKTP